MRILIILMAAVGTLMLAGCESPALVSMDPVATEANTVFDASLLGTWEISEGGDLCILRRAHGDVYAITYVSDEGVRQFEGRLFLAGQARVMDLTPRDSDDFRVPAHALIRILSSGATLRWTYLDSAWLRQQAARELVTRPRGEGKLLLNAPLAGFLARYAGDERAYGEVQEWQRLY